MPLRPFILPFIALFFLLSSDFCFAEEIAAPGFSLTNAETPQSTEGSFQENITIINESNYKIKTVRCIAISKGNNQAQTEFGPVPAHDKKSAQFAAWQGGTFAVEVDYEIEGKTTKSRPFTSNLNYPQPVPAVKLIFGDSKRSSGGVWKNIVWENSTPATAPTQTPPSTPAATPTTPTKEIPLTDKAP